MDLDQLDLERHGPMVVRLAGKNVVLPCATDLPWRVVTAVTSDLIYFGTLIWPKDVGLPRWKLPHAQRAWVRHNGLPEPEQMRRLVYMFERYYSGIEYDLRSKLGLSAGELWRDRRWRELLNMIDQLPADTQMNRLLSQDEEYMKALIRGRPGGAGPSRPSMADWSLTNSLLAQIVDAVHRDTAVAQAIANPKGPKPRIDPVARPATAADKVEREVTRERHEEMVGLLLPRRDQGEVS